jgi:hypothetical protein
MGLCAAAKSEGTHYRLFLIKETDDEERHLRFDVAHRPECFD